MSQSTGHLLRQARYLIFPDELTVHSHALAKGVQVRLGIETGTNAARLQNGRDHDSGRALPLGSGDMGDTIGLMRIAQLRQQLTLPLEIVFAISYKLSGALGIAE